MADKPKGAVLTMVGRYRFNVVARAQAKTKADDKLTPAATVELERLRKEIAEAHRDWLHAQHHFENAIGADQIDYAIYAVETAQKRYEMLLRQAKRMSGSWPAWKGEALG